MQDDTWILLYRKITDNRLWKEKPFDKSHAWIDLLILANYAPSSFWVRGCEIKVERGQLAWSIERLSDRWGWDRKKVMRFLDGLESVQQIGQQKNNVTTLITIINYDQYQVNGTAERTAERTASGTHKKEVKEVKNKIPSSSGDEVDVIITKKKKNLTGKRLETFLLFWEAFDYKKGKAEAADAWIDIERLTMTVVEKIVSAAKSEAAIRSGLIAEGKTPKMAQGWLSGRRWEDEAVDKPTNKTVDPHAEARRKVLEKYGL